MVFRKDLIYGIVTTFTEPILYLVAFGYGLGTMVGEVKMDGVVISYRQFIYAGIVAQAVLFQSFFDAAYGSFIRMYYQRIFKGMATAPLTLSEVLWGELLWDASRATFGASAVLLIGVITHNFDPLGALLCLPVAFLGSAIFAGMGLWASSIARSIESINYPQYLIIFPMFLFCGVYYPLEQLPKIGQYIAWFFPLTPLVHVIRGLSLKIPFSPWALLAMLGWAAVLVVFSRRAMLRRLVR